MVPGGGVNWARLSALRVNYGLMILVSTVAVLLASIVAVASLARALPNDFLSFYYAGQAVARSTNIYDTLELRKLAHSGGVPNTVFPYLYSPFLAEVLSLFAKVPLNRLYRVWLELLVGSTALTGLLACTIHKVSLRGGAATVVPLMITVICVLVLPFTNNYALGQVNLIVMAFVILALVSYLSGCPLLAGALLAPAVLLKGTPLVLLGFFLARRSLRAIVGFAAASISLFIVSLIIGGAKPWLDYLAVLPLFAYGKDIPNLFPATTICNFSPAGHLLRVFTNERELAAMLSIALAGSVFAVAVASAFFARNRREEALALALFFPVMIVVAPLAYLHHVIYLVPAAVIWLTWAFVEKRSVVFGILVLVLAICGTDWPLHYGNLGQLFARPSSRGLNLFAIGLVFCIGLLAYGLARRSGTVSFHIGRKVRDMLAIR